MVNLVIVGYVGSITGSSVRFTARSQRENPRLLYWSHAGMLYQNSIFGKRVLTYWGIWGKREIPEYSQMDGVIVPMENYTFLERLSIIFQIDEQF